MLLSGCAPVLRYASTKTTRSPGTARLAGTSAMRVVPSAASCLLSTSTREVTSSGPAAATGAASAAPSSRSERIIGNSSQDDGLEADGAGRAGGHVAERDADGAAVEPAGVGVAAVAER